jgi:hypothetical protein
MFFRHLIQRRKDLPVGGLLSPMAGCLVSGYEDRA